jgi:catechol 2,3-dioxygenase-like lactoylglutathione lyase family enzyme
MLAMTSTAIRITCADFAYIPVTDFGAVKRFYGDVLGLEQSKQYGKMPGGEGGTGTLTLQILQPEAFGQHFHRNPNPIALHVEDVHEACAARVPGDRVPQRNDGQRRLPHGRLPGPRRARADAASPLRAPEARPPGID